MKQWGRAEWGLMLTPFLCDSKEPPKLIQGFWWTRPWEVHLAELQKCSDVKVTAPGSLPLYLLAPPYFSTLASAAFMRGRRDGAQVSLPQRRTRGHMYLSKWAGTPHGGDELKLLWLCWRKVPKSPSHTVTGGRGIWVQLMGVGYPHSGEQKLAGSCER